MKIKQHNNEYDGISVFLMVFDVDPDDLATVLGFQPSLSFRKGDPWPPVPSRVRDEHKCMIKSPLYHNATVEEQADALVSILEPRIHHFVSLSSPLFRLVYSFYCEYKPVLRITSKQINFLARINADIDMDINYSSDPYVRESGVELTEDIIHIGLGINDIESELVTDILGIQPISIDQSHELYPELQQPCSNKYAWETGVQYRRPRDDTKDLFPFFEQKVNELIDVLKPKIYQFSKLPSYRACLECRIYTNNGMGLEFTKEQVLFISEINAAVNIDLNYHYVG